MANITLTNSNINGGNAVSLDAASISYSWKNLTLSKPLQHSFKATEVQYNGWENPLFSLSFIIRPNDLRADVMTWHLFNSFLRQKPTSDNKTTLNITTGGLTAQGTSGSSAAFTSYAESEQSSGRTNIPVVIMSADVKFDAGNSNNGYFWMVNAKMAETE